MPEKNIRCKGEIWEFIPEELTPSKAIRKMCLQCMCGDTKTLKECEDEDCPLHPFRFGHNPFSKRKGNPEALKKYREGKNS